MAQPTPYAPAVNFADDERANAGGRSTVRTDKVDDEFDAVAVSLNQTITNLGLIQRDDGKLRDDLVEAYNLTTTAKLLLGGAGWNVAGLWATSHSYAVNDLVDKDTASYVCVTAHTSGTFSTDYAAGKWVFIAGSGYATLQAQLAASSGAALIGYLAKVAATARTVEDRLRDFPTVNDFGAGSSKSGAVNYTAIMAAIAAWPGRSICLPDSSYTVSSPLVADADSTRLSSPGTTIVYTGADGTDAVTFRCTSTATLTTFLSGCGIDGITIYSPTARTSGVGLRLTQCNLFDLGRVRVDNFFGGMLVEGGQLFHGESFTTFMSVSLYPSVVTGAYQLKFKNAPIDGGLYQQPFTFVLDKIRTGGSYSAELGVVFEAADGITIASGYIAGSYQSLLRIKPGVSGKSVSGVDMGNCYLDGKNQVSGTLNGIEILDDGFAGASLVNNVDFSSLLLVGNLQGKGIYSTHPNLQDIEVPTGRFVNVAGTEIDVLSGDTSQDSWIGVLLPWTPTLTFATPGNLAVTYSSRLGTFIRDAAGLVHVSFSVVTSAFTHTTASGALWLSGVPVGTSSGLTVRPYSALQFNGITKAGYTDFACDMPSSSTAVVFSASGSGVALSDVTAADCPSGGTMILRGTLSFPASELG